MSAAMKYGHDGETIVDGGFFFGKDHPSIRVTGPALITNNVIMRRPRKWYHLREWFRVFRYVVNLPHDS